MRTLAAITLTKAARASKSTASFPACETSDPPFKSPRCRQPHDRRYRPIHPSQLGQRSTHRPPDGGQTARSRRLCFYLGAGASKECRNAEGKSPPDANQLRDILAKKFFGKAMTNRDVMTVAEMAIESGAGRPL